MIAVVSLGHNAALVRDERREQMVVHGRGVGFGIKPGATIDPARVEQVFRATPTMPIERLAQILPNIPLEIVQLASEIVDTAMRRLGVAVGPGLVLPLADHLALAIPRAEQSADTHPLQWEIQQLYPEEYALGVEALHIVHARTGVDLPVAEAAAVALHLINARFAEDSLASTLKMTQLIPRILEVVAQSATVTIDHSSMSVTRFVTHLRYLFVRLSRGTQLLDLHETLLSAIPSAHPKAYQTAIRVQYLIESEMGGRLSGDEVAYLTLHIARMLADVDQPGSV